MARWLQAIILTLLLGAPVRSADPSSASDTAPTGVTAPRPARSTEKLYDGFETEEDLTIPVLFNASLSRSPIHYTQGDWSGYVYYRGGPDSRLYFANHASWWPASVLAFDVTTDEQDPVTLQVTIEAHDVQFPVTVVVKPGRDARVAIPCDGLVRGRIDPVDMDAYSISGTGPPLIPMEVTGFSIGIPRGGKPAKIYLDNVRLVDSSDRRGAVLIDEYGQYAPTVWPGKVAQDEDLQRDAALEQPVLRRWRWPSHQDRYGGLKEAPRAETPYFSTQKVDGKWWFIDPDGHRFFAVGSNGVSIAANEFDAAPIFLYYAPPKQGIKANFLASNLMTKYGPQYEMTWQKRAEARLHSWGFNCLGPGSDRLLALEMPSVVDLGDSTSMTGIHLIGPFPDVYDPAFPSAAVRALKGATELASSPFVIGFTFDHALPWDRLADPNYVLSAGGPAADALKKIASAHGGPPSEGDAAQFQAEFAARYFDGIASALRAADYGHHLYLGCRFTSSPDAVVQACARRADVLTFDCWDDAPARAAQQAATVGRPALISAFGSGAADRGLIRGGKHPVANQAERARAYATFLHDASEEPLIVGCLWESFVDPPAVTAAGAGANSGLVTITDRPYEELVTAAAAANRAALETRKSPARMRSSR